MPGTGRPAHGASTIRRWRALQYLQHLGRERWGRSVADEGTPRMNHAEEGRDERSLDRLVNFSDAVFAIAITLLALDVRLSGLDMTVVRPPLAPQIIELLPNLFAFALELRGHRRVLGGAPPTLQVRRALRHPDALAQPRGAVLHRPAAVPHASRCRVRRHHAGRVRSTPEP